MAEKRYFKREWEEEYYIFDSQVISEKEFDEKVEYEDYQAFSDSMTGDDVVNQLNELNEIYLKLKHRHSLLHDEYADVELERNRLQNDVNSLEKENKELRGKSSSWKITASEEISEKQELMKENVKLKQENKELKKEDELFFGKVFDILLKYQDLFNREMADEVLEELGIELTRWFR